MFFVRRYCSRGTGGDNQSDLLTTYRTTSAKREEVRRKVGLLCRFVCRCKEDIDGGYRYSNTKQREYCRAKACSVRSGTRERRAAAAAVERSMVVMVGGAHRSKIGLSIVRQECHPRHPAAAAVVPIPSITSESSHLSLDLPSNDESCRHPNMSQPLIGA